MKALHQNVAAQHDYPHETQFSSLEKSEFLTRAFHNPSSVVDDPGYFQRHPSFYTITDTEGIPTARQVVFVGWEIDKRLLAYPFFGALVISVVIALSVGIRMGDVATGAQVGGTFCGIVATVFCYVIWRCC